MGDVFTGAAIPPIMLSMSVFFDLIYFFAGVFALPFLIRKSRRTGKYRADFPARFGQGADIFPYRPPTAKVLLLHTVSVGELLSIHTLINQLLAADKNLLIVVSTSTDTGTARGQILFPPAGQVNHHPRVAAVRFPLDFSFAIETFFDRVRPNAVALIELETWPNFLRIAKSRRIPVGLINGRLSAKSFPRYMIVRPLMQAMLRQLTFLAVQTQTIRDRFVALGAPPERTEIIPTLKYDSAPTSSNIPGQVELAAAMGVQPGCQLFVAGSIAPGEEEAVLNAFLALREKHTGLRLAIAPRHPEAVAQMVAAIREKSLAPRHRSERPDGASRVDALDASQVFVLNTLGELKKLYALAAFVFVGRSLVKLGGSDMIEVAALAKPVCFGPYTQNFAEAVELLLQNGAAVQVMDEASLVGTLAEWLEHPRDAAATGLRAQELINQQRGSTSLYVQKLLALMNPRP